MLWGLNSPSQLPPCCATGDNCMSITNTASASSDTQNSGHEDFGTRRVIYNLSNLGSVFRPKMPRRRVSLAFCCPSSRFLFLVGNREARNMKFFISCQK